MPWQLRHPKQRLRDAVTQARTGCLNRAAGDRTPRCEPDLLRFIRSAPDFELLELERASNSARPAG